jgi:predicted acylesterase/phospholipase RssA
VDLVLSSGFLAFARHVGFLEAVEVAELEIDAIVGTSSGAIVGALWAAGLPPRDAGKLILGAKLKELFDFYPIPWRGVFSLAKVVSALERVLPASFDALRRPFAVGVSAPEGHRLLTGGPLPLAVAASCAMPGIFGPITIDGVPYRDGGAKDRLGIDAWRTWRRGRTALVHHVQRTAGVDVACDLSDITVVKTPRSRASFFSLRDFDEQADEARRITAAALGTDVR